MQDTLLSPYWYRISALHPRLKPHVSVRMQTTRGQAWYVMFNQATGRYHRVNAQAYELVGRLDGRHSVDEVWSVLLDQLGDEAPSQHDVIRILGQMTDAGLIQAEVAPDVRQLVKDGNERQRKEKRARLNPFSFRLGLFNPSAMLERLVPLGRLFWNSWATAFWFLLVIGTTWAVLANLPEVLAYGRHYFMSPAYLAAAWLIYPLMKALHELGHALALRRYGCEVPEVGVNFFMFVPMPYVDASSSNRLVNRWQRARISVAGIGVELALAALAAIVWLNVEDGWVRQASFVVMSLGGLSTLLFNGNPLMKLDGYYVLCDALDLPNLAGRSGRMMGQVWRTLFMGLLGVRRDTFDNNVTAADAFERWALWLYAPASWVYRVVVSALIVSWAADKAAWLGVGVAAWSFWTLFAQPIWAWTQALASQPSVTAMRGRLVTAVGGAVVVGAAAAMMVPLPSSLVVEGMVWLPDDALVRAAADGEVETVWARSDTPVEEGARLVSLKSPALTAQREVLQAQIERSEAEFNASFGSEPLKMRNAQDALARDRATLAQVDRDLAANVLRAGTAGRFVMSRQEDLEGLQVNRGQVLAYVLNDRPAVIRAVVPQRDIDSVRHRLRSVQVMLDESPGHAMPAHLLREVPAATDRLPQATMGDRKGGRVPTDPSDEEGLRPMEPTYVVDVQLNHGLARAGGLARVRLDLAPQSLLDTVLQRLRQLLLRHFSDVRT